MYKIIVLLFVIMTISGCSPNPVPEEAVKKCLDKGGIPIYHSYPAQTDFVCIPAGSEVEIN